MIQMSVSMPSKMVNGEILANAIITAIQQTEQAIADRREYLKIKQNEFLMLNNLTIEQVKSLSEDERQLLQYNACRWLKIQDGQMIWNRQNNKWSRKYIKEATIQ